MRSINEIARQLNADMQTRQITNAMYLLSVSEIRRMSGSISYIRGHMNKLRRTIADIICRSGEVDHSFLQKKDFQANVSGFFVISSDKSLCGAYNSGIVNLAEEQIRSAKNPVIITAGNHGDALLRRHGFDIDRTEDASLGVTLQGAVNISDRLIEGYLNGEYDELYIVYTAYRSQARQYPSCVKLFPLSVDDFAEETAENKMSFGGNEMIYEPSVRSVFETLVNEYVTTIVYSAFMQSAMSEHTARMNAMQAATKNADKMIESLRLQYNTARQLAITNEIAEISAAAEIASHGV